MTKGNRCQRIASKPGFAIIYFWISLHKYTRFLVSENVAYFINVYNDQNGDN